MPIGRPKPPLVLNPEESEQLRTVAASRTLPHGLVRRARIILLSASGMSNQAIAARLEKLARFLEHQWLAAAASLREGLEETFTLNRLGLPPRLHRCLTSTNIVESPHSGVRLRTRRICRWRDGRMVLRWAAAAFLITEKNFRKIQGYRDLWMLKAVPEENSLAVQQRVEEVA